jgi:hypothetical protein
MSVSLVLRLMLAVRMKVLSLGIEQIPFGKPVPTFPGSCLRKIAALLSG